MVRETGASPNTLKTTFTSLVKKGLLVRHGGGRSTWYALRALRDPKNHSPLFSPDRTNATK
jgi:predicted transcriptional regulator